MEYPRILVDDINIKLPVITKKSGSQLTYDILVYGMFNLAGKLMKGS